MAAKFVIPKSLSILGKNIPVKRGNLKDAHGQFDRTDFEITLDTKCPAHLIEETLMHEAMHAVLWISGVSQLLREDLEEAICFATEGLTNSFKVRK